MNRIELKFQQLRKRRKKAFIAFITAGYPDLAVTKELIVELAAKGVDIIELGVPFSDPLADGPIIQEASQHALKKGVTLGKILNLVKAVRKNVDIPICLMTYYNPIFCFGEESFVKEAVDSGVDGVIVPDLPPEEARGLIKPARKAGLDTIFFLSPTSSKKRIKSISAVSSGFIYYVSLTGVTGPRQKLPPDIKNNVKFIKRHTKKAVCVGFGISGLKQVKQISKFADGVIVGSAIVRKIKENKGKRSLAKIVAGFVESLGAKPVS